MLLRDVPPKTQTVINIFIIRRVNEEGEIIIDTLSLGNKLWHGETTFPQSHTSEISMELPNKVSGLLFFFICFFLCMRMCDYLCVVCTMLHSGSKVLDFKPAESWTVHLIRDIIAVCNCI